jgi:hypothetical protein
MNPAKQSVLTFDRGKALCLKHTHTAVQEIDIADQHDSKEIN